MDFRGLNLHIHTRASHDAHVDFKPMMRILRDMGTTIFAITDHDTMEGVLQFQNWAGEHSKEMRGMEMIPGEEITCDDGTHVLGYFLTHPIPSRLPVLDTVKRIRDQNGLVCFAHPYRNDGILKSKEGESALRLGHFFEGFNGKAPHVDNIKALEAFRESPLLPLGSSDAHYLDDLKKAQTLLPAHVGARATLEEFLRHKKVRIMGHPKSESTYDYHQHFYEMKKFCYPPKWVRNIIWKADPYFRNLRGRYKDYKRVVIYDSL